MTTKRALENYLHPLAILQAGGVSITFTDDDSVPLLVSQAMCHKLDSELAWRNLSPRARKRRCERAKVWLNTRAVDCMTIQQLNERDPEGEIAAWLQTIAELLGTTR